MLTIHVWPKRLKAFLLTHPLYKSPLSPIKPQQVPAMPKPAVQKKLVGAAGFEPTTTCAQGRCATRLRYAPMKASRNYLRNAA